MGIFYKPEVGWAGDVIPFYWQGEYHVFYLRTLRDPADSGLVTSWEHIGTRDLIHFVEYPQALPEVDRSTGTLYSSTGSVLERGGVFHIFYHGKRNRRETGSELAFEAIMHATSQDSVTWTEDAANPILEADPSRYEPDDWRDPFVFWNDEAGEYWMLMAARLRKGPSRRRGCTALATSADLVSWQIQEPFWTPSSYYTHECPDLFRMGDWWYLLYSTFSERHVTHYRMSRSLSGPWIGPNDDAFDTRAFYAAKTASDGQRRFLFGWNPTREGETDSGRWQWAGNIVVHEVDQAPDGALLVKPLPETATAFATPEPPDVGALNWAAAIGEWTRSRGVIVGDGGDGYAACRLGRMPEACRITVSLRWTPGTRCCGVLLRADGELEGCYEVRYEPGRGRIVFDRWPRPGDEPYMLERPLALAAGEALVLNILIDGSLVEVYANERVALSTRAYDHPAGDWGLFVAEGRATFSELAISEDQARS